MADGTYQGPSAKNEILAYIHCKRCIVELQSGSPEADGQSPETFARLSVGWTRHGLQVVCVRHQVNVLNIDFEGHKHPANTTMEVNG